MKTLLWFMQHATSDAVRINVQTTTEDGDTYDKDVTLSNDALTAHAVAAGRATWDESDICALANCVMPEVVVPVVEPIVEPVVEPSPLP